MRNDLETESRKASSEPMVLTLLGLSLAALGLLSYFVFPWVQFGPFSQTGLELASATDSRWWFLRATPAVFVTILAAILVPRGLVVGVCCIAAAALTGIGLSELAALAASKPSFISSVIGYGLHASLFTLVGGVALAVRLNRLAARSTTPAHPLPMAVALLSMAIALAVSFRPTIESTINNLLTSRDDRAIRLVQQTSKPELILTTTWQQYAESTTTAADEPRWTAREIEPDLFLVSYLNTAGANKDCGLFWEARLSDSTVRFINDDEFLSAKHGIGGTRDDVPFEIQLDSSSNLLGANAKGDIAASFSGTITNKTGKTLVSAELSCALVVIFSEHKVVRVESGLTSSWATGSYPTARTKPTISKTRPWRDGETIEFVAKTETGIEALYREYDATSARVEVVINTADPIDFKYAGIILTHPFEWADLRTLEATNKLREIASAAVSRCTRDDKPRERTASIAYSINRDGTCLRAEVTDPTAPERWLRCIEDAITKAKYPKSPHLEGGGLAKGSLTISWSEAAETPETRRQTKPPRSRLNRPCASDDDCDENQTCQLGTTENGQVRPTCQK